jgi:hypothetical protein
MKVMAAEWTRPLLVLVLIAVSASMVFLAGRLSVTVMPLDTTTVQADREARSAPVAASGVPASAQKPEEPKASMPPAVASEPGSGIKEPPPVPSSVSGAPPQASAEPAAKPAPAEQKMGERALSGADGEATAVPPASGPPGQPTATPGRTVIINPSQPAAPTSKSDEKREVSAGIEPRGKPDDAAAGQCEKRYSSFRRSDGTYQPFDGGPRKRCPLLP